MSADERMAFITAAHTDAYTAALARMWSDAWALGYEAARRDITAAAAGERGYVDRDHPLHPVLARLDEDGGFSEMRRRGGRELTESSERAAVQAMATLAPLLWKP